MIRPVCPADFSFPHGSKISKSDVSESPSGRQNDFKQSDCLGLGKVTNHSAQENVETSSSMAFELYKMQTTIVVKRETFLNVICSVLSEYKYVGPNQRADLVLACRYYNRSDVWNSLASYASWIVGMLLVYICVVWTKVYGLTLCSEYMDYVFLTVDAIVAGCVTSIGSYLWLLIAYFYCDCLFFGNHPEP